jgi:hypothetical protein
LAQACVRCLRQTSIRVGSRLCPMRTAGRSTTICIRPLAIRRSLVPGRPFCHAAASRQARLRFDRPDQSSTRRYRRFTCFACLSSCACVLNLFAWGSGVGSAGVQPTRNSPADGVLLYVLRRNPKPPELFCWVRQSSCLQNAPRPLGATPRLGCRRGRLRRRELGFAVPEALRIERLLLPQHVVHGPS